MASTCLTSVIVKTGIIRSGAMWLMEVIGDPV